MIYLMLMFIAFKPSNAEKIESLCKNPVIFTADRLLNDSVRLYRDTHYWELSSLPAIEATLTGPHKVWSPYMAPIHANTSIVTIHGGRAGNDTFKFEGKKWWMWSPNGLIDIYLRPLFAKTSNQILQEEVGGYEIVMHNGNREKPLLIGFKSEEKNGIRMSRLYYFSAEGLPSDWSVYPNASHGYQGFLGGMHSENYPPDLDAAFTWPSLDTQNQYYIYMFKGDKYCFRPQIPKRDANNNTVMCEKWRESRELFGCYKSEQIARPIDPNGDNADNTNNDNINTNNTKKPSNNDCSISHFTNYSIILLFLTFNNILKFF